jgi:signal transduction histidine kinase
MAATAVEVGGRASRLLQAEVMALVVVDNAQGIWMPRLAQGCSLEPVSDPAELPPPLDLVAGGAVTGVVSLGRPARGGVSPSRSLVEGSRSGIYAPLRGREGIIGVFMVEHSDPDRWRLDDLKLVAGLVEVLAVTADNARSVRRLQTRGAIEHRHDAARDLHDEFGQVLTTLGLEVDRLRSSGGADADDLDKLRDAVSAASVEVRSALRALRLPPLGVAGFAGAAEDLIARLRGTGPIIELEVAAPDRRAGGEVEQQMVGILQEALTNARRHGQASSVTVRWSVDEDGAAHHEVEDYGVGFEPPTGPAQTIGLVGMAERAELLDGRMRVHSAPGQGCRIVVDAPPWERG